MIGDRLTPIAECHGDNIFCNNSGLRTTHAVNLAGNNSMRYRPCSSSSRVGGTLCQQSDSSVGHDVCVRGLFGMESPPRQFLGPKDQVLTESFCKNICELWGQGTKLKWSHKVIHPSFCNVISAG